MKYIQKHILDFSYIPHQEHEISLIIENINDLNQHFMPFKLNFTKYFKYANGVPYLLSPT